jgi:hypothetical protein
VKSKKQTAKQSHSRGWFRFYSEAVEDPKVQRLPPSLFKAWVNLLCVAAQNGGVLLSVSDMAFKLRMSDNDMQQNLDELIMLGLVDIIEPGKLIPHNWLQRQYISDLSTERVKRFRKRFMKRGAAVSETAPDSDSDSDSDSDQNPPLAPPEGEGRAAFKKFGRRRLTVASILAAREQ